MWLKYKHKWAWGGDKEWCCKDIGGLDVNEALKEITDEYSYSDKYRGVDYEVVEIPSSEIIKKEIAYCADRISGLRRRMDRLISLLADAELLERHEDLEDIGPHSWKPNV